MSFDSWPYSKQVFVVSNSLKEIQKAFEGKAELITGKPQEIVSRLNREGFINLYIDGGITIQRFLADNLIDELIITKVPILLGEGISLFGNMERETKLTHKNTEVFSNGLVKSHYVKGQLM
jgi:dihydrofolate reductase